MLPFVALMQLCQPSRDLLSRSMTISGVFWNGTSQDMRVSESAIGSGMFFFNTDPVLSVLWVVAKLKGWKLLLLTNRQMNVLQYRYSSEAENKTFPSPFEGEEETHN